MATGHYFRSPQKWTLDRDEALDFEVVAKAMKVAHNLHIRDLELELSFEDHEHVTATPFETFLRGLTRAGKRQLSSRRTSRSTALA